MTKQLTFVNHASFHVANDTTLLLVDPWLEGAVFNNGWSLLDSATSNGALVRDLSARKLATFIWISHEHPDNFCYPLPGNCNSNLRARSLSCSSKPRTGAWRASCASLALM